MVQNNGAGGERRQFENESVLPGLGILNAHPRLRGLDHIQCREAVREEVQGEVHLTTGILLLGCRQRSPETAKFTWVRRGAPTPGLGDVVGGEQPAEQADRRLEDGHVDVAVEREAPLYEVDGARVQMTVATVTERVEELIRGSF